MLDRRRRNVVFGTIMLGVLLAALDQTIVGTALPTIVADLGGAAHMSWVVTSYLLAETVATVLVGKFGDLFDASSSSRSPPSSSSPAPSCAASPPT